MCGRSCLPWMREIKSYVNQMIDMKYLLTVIGSFGSSDQDWRYSERGRSLSAYSCFKDFRKVDGC